MASPGTYGAFETHARSAALVAALALSFTAVAFALSEVSPATATVFRAAYALPFLWWLARREDRVAGGRPWLARRWALLAGVFFAIDLVLFHQAILLMGAGLASVMSNLQVVVVLVAAWLIWGERPSLRQALGIPVALVGILLISGLLDADAYGSDPVAGSLLGILVAFSYAAYLLLIRKGRDLEHAAGPVFDASLACALTGVVAGVATSSLELTPALPGHAWLMLLAVSGQVVGSVLIAVALPRLPAATTSLILLVQPVLAVLIAMVLLDERPSTAQLVGVGLVIGGVLLGSAVRRPTASSGGGGTHDPAPLEA
jgi:drug/metabolite transporter (DMT)-like permease